MGLYPIVIQMFCVVYVTSATNFGRLYESVTCLSVTTVTSYDNSMTILECAILCDIDNLAAFSFNIQTGECSVFIEEIIVSPTCGIPGDVQFFKLNDNCALPIPPGYRLEHPYYGSSSLARYRCAAFNHQPPVDSCPVVTCDGPHNFTATPASCSVNDVFNSSSLTEYEGGVTCTVKGVTCQRWDSNYPHVPGFNIGRSDLRNRCQRGGENRPWCYTTDPAKRFDFCPVEDLDCGAPPTILPPVTWAGVGITTEWPYLGSNALGWYRCTSYTIDDPVSSCPVTRCDGDLTWSKANISCSEKDCYDVASQSYQGRVSCTHMGYTCQRWDSDYPQRHTILEGRSDLHNWCQMEGDSRPWCYTTEPSVRYAFCAVAECPGAG